MSSISTQTSANLPLLDGETGSAAGEPCVAMKSASCLSAHRLDELPPFFICSWISTSSSSRKDCAHTSRHVPAMKQLQEAQSCGNRGGASHRTLEEAGDPRLLLRSRAGRGVLGGLDVLRKPVTGAALHRSAFGSGGCTHLLSFFSHNFRWPKRTERHIFKKNCQ